MISFGQMTTLVTNYFTPKSLQPFPGNTVTPPSCFSNIFFNPFNPIIGESLHEAIVCGDLNSVMHFLNQGVDINAYDAQGRAPLHLAAATGRIDILKILIANGANLQMPAEPTRALPIHFAAGNNHVSAMNLLLAFRSDPNAKDSNEATPLHWAAYWGAYESIVSLIHRGADIHLKTNSGADALICAYLNSKSRIVDLLEELGLNRDYVSKFFHLKVASSFWGIEGNALLAEKSLKNIEGGFPSMTFPTVTNALKSFIADTVLPYWLNQDDVKMLLKHLNDGLENMYLGPTELANKILQQKCVIISTGWNGHAIEIFFYDSYLFICNKGEGHTSQPVVIYKIDPNKINKHTISHMQRANHLFSAKEGVKFFYNDLPEALGSDPHDPYLQTLNDIFKKLPSKWQKIGNCSTASVKTLIFALLLLIHSKKESNPTIVIKETLSFYKQWTEYSRVHLLEAFLSDYITEEGGLSEEIDLNLVRRFIRKWESKPCHNQEYENRMSAIINTFPELKSAWYDSFLPTFLWA